MDTRFDKNKLSIWVDIDETICQTPPTRKYSESIPIYENIERVNKLFNMGHEVVYWTARGSGSGIDWKDLTEKQLSAWGVNHHELRMGKPSYDLLICDKTDRIENL